jgi:phosphopantothenoylcysteine synthetase/decarboxylase
MHEFIVFLFAIAAGITASGLIASIYRLIAGEPKTKIGTVLHYAVMVIAGPVVLVSNSTKSYRDKKCSKAAYALAIALSFYWSFVTGVVILSVWVAIRGA